MRLLGALLTALPLLACRSEDLVFIQRPAAPADLAYAAVIAVDANGVVARASPLLPWASAILRLDQVALSEAGTVELVGFAAETIAKVGPPTDGALTTSAVREAKGCDPKLPAPDWSARFDQDGRLLAALAAPRPLTTRWLEAACPTLAPVTSVDVRCTVRTCPIAVAQDGCELTIDLTTCALGVHSFAVDWAGATCDLGSSQRDCAVVAARPPAVASVECDGSDPCAIDVYAAAESPFTVDTVPVVRGVPPHVPNDVVRSHLRGADVFTGYVSGLAVLPDRVAVSTFDGRFAESPECSDAAPSRTVLVDPDTLAEIESATTPPCLRNLVAAPGHRGFFGTFGSTRARGLAELDEHARVLRAHQFELAEESARVAYDDVELLAAKDGRRLLALLRRFDPTSGGTPGFLVLALDLGTLSEHVLFSQPAGTAWGMAESDDGLLVIIDEDSDDLWIVDSLTGVQTRERYGLAHLDTITAAKVTYFPATNEFLVPNVYAEQTIHSIALDPVNDVSVTFFEHDAGPMLASAWPTDPNRAIVAAADTSADGPRDVWLALFDPHERRFRPGSARLGFGVPGQLVPAGDGAFATLPWEGSLARISPRR